ncbi:serine/threonine-protein kinase [Belnapia rosea]|uniref:serine/threonine-protein kinase n=1 Tax=Belnapia rosea TaxID=938405 RepID=UPI00088406CD|nr:serine/threonine-protein kinase [Belnapia rosea]SDB68220.1 Protein kinase domain-containing protein [Belnapia rosea]
MIPNEIAGKYELRGTLGSGAMGTVYDALDRNIERRVAIKVVKLPSAGDPEGEEAHGRFRREAQAAGRLAHPNIVGVYDYGENAESAWIVMELVEGGSLKDRLDRKERFPVPEIVRIMEEVLAALAYSHGRGVVHRDIKPANIMLTGEGAVKMADFGIARLENSSMTQIGTVMGTPSYMAPEQLRGETVDARADIWAAGVMLYQLLTGEKPFEGGFSAVMHKALHTEPPPPSRLSVTAPQAFDAVIARALAKRPEDRYPGATAFAAAIRAAAAAPAAAPEAGGFSGAGPLPGLDSDATLVGTMPPAAPPGPAMPAPPPAPQPTRARKAPVGLIAGGAGALAAAGILAFMLLGGGDKGTDQQRLEQLRQAAEQEARQRAEATQPVPAPQAATEPATPTPPPRAEAEIERRLREEEGRRAEQARQQQAAEQARQQQAAEQARQQQAAEQVRQQQAAEQARQQQAAEQARQQAAEQARQQQVVEEARRRADQLRADLAAAGAALAATPCSLLSWNATATRLTLTGIIRRGDEALLRQQAAARGLPGDAVQMQLRGFDGPYCAALDLLRPYVAGQDASPQAGIIGATPLAKGELLRLSVTMPPWPGHLTVSYLMQSGEVAHLVPSRAEAPNAQLRLGEPAGSFTGWEVDEPFGTDLVLVVTSDRPILAQRRPVVEKAEDYLRALAPALRAAQAQNGRVAVQAVLVETVARR